MELCASIRGTEYDATIAERIQFIYQTYLLVNRIDPHEVRFPPIGIECDSHLFAPSPLQIG